MMARGKNSRGAEARKTSASKGPRFQPLH